MIERIPGAPQDVLALKAVGRVESSDYTNVFAPALADEVRRRGKVRLVYELGPEFEGYAAGATWQDLKLGMSNFSAWERCAVVTEHHLMGDAVKILSPLMPGEVRVFPVSALNDALAWAAA